MKYQYRIIRFLLIIIISISLISLDFRFEKQVFAQGADESFSIVVLPDTQFYSQDYPEIFTAQTQWIVNNKTLHNIAYVAHEGDIVEVRSDLTQWTNASTAMGLLEDPAATGLIDGIPYNVVPGNHDEYPVIDTYNMYFGVSRFQGRSYYGGSFPTGDNRNNYSLFSAGGMDFIVIGLGFSDYTPGNYAWADGLLKTYSNRRGIVVSHSIIDASASFSPYGQQIYDTLKDNPNLFLMLCGHVGDSEALRTDTYNGNTVYSLLADFQNRDPLFHGGDGWLRLLTFSPETNEIAVKTYSPYLNLWQTDGNSQFVLPYDMSGNLPQVTGIRRANTNPTGLGSVNFTVSFNTSVTGVDETDFALYTTGAVSNASVTSVSGSGNQYHVSVNTGTGDGTIRLDLIDDDSIVNSVNDPIGGAGINNGSYLNGETYTISKITPSPTISAETTTITFNPSADAVIKDASPSTNYGVNTSLTVDSSPVQQILMKFDVSGLSNYSVESAKLRLYSTAGSNATGGIFYQTANTSWIESGTGGVAWNTAPVANATPIINVGPISNNIWVEVDLTSIITSDGQYGFRIISNNSDGASYNSRESSTNNPELVLKVTRSGGEPSTTPSIAPTITPTFTSTTVSTSTPTPTFTSTSVSISTNTPTFTSTVAPINTPTSTRTPMFTPSYTPTHTPSHTPTVTFSPTPTTPSDLTTLIFHPSADAMIKEAFPSINYGVNTSLTVDSSPVQQILMKFDVSGLSNYSVESAKLRLYATAGSNATGGIFYQTANTSWIESGTGGVTWNTAPVANAAPIINVGPISNNIWVEVDITSLVNSDGQYGFRIISNNSDGASYNSKESPTNIPELVLKVTRSGGEPSTTPSSIPTFTPTFTSTTVSTSTPTPTFTSTTVSTRTNTPTSTFTSTVIPINTPTSTFTPVVAPSDTPTITPSFTPTITLSPTPTTPSGLNTLTFHPSADAIIKEAYPSTNYGVNSSLIVDGSPVQQILMKFDVFGLSNYSVESVKLRLYATAGSNATGGIFYRTADTSWIETGTGGVTWSSAPTADESPIINVGPIGNNIWVEVDLTTIVTSDGQFSFRIISNNSDGASYNSKESSTNVPELVISYR